MKNRLVGTATVLMLLPAASAFAQRVEVSVIGGWTLSDGVSGDPILAGDGHLYDRVDAKDSGSWGFGVGVNASDNAEVGFLFGQQLSTLENQRDDHPGGWGPHGQQLSRLLCI